MDCPVDHPDLDKLITARNEVGAKLCFHRRVWFCSRGWGGCLPQCILGYTPLGADTPGSRHPPEQTHPRSRHPSKQTAPQSRHPPCSRHPWEHPPQSRHPPEHTPPGAHTPRSTHPPGAPPGAHTPLQSMLGDTVNARAVRILLECNLVFLQFPIFWQDQFHYFLKHGQGNLASDVLDL